MASNAKQAAQEALFTAIKNAAERNVKAAVQASEKAQILRELAEAYRLTAGGTTLGVAAAAGGKSNGGSTRSSQGAGTQKSGRESSGREGKGREQKGTRSRGRKS